MQKVLAWFDQHGLFALSLFLLLFIPLYPKLPLFEAIPGYLVRVRIEDLLVGLTGLVWSIQVVRKKAALDWPVLLVIVGYGLAGLLSLVVAIGLQQTIPLQLLHIGKSGLHFARYLEYFSLFFFLYAGVKTKTHLNIALASIVIAVAVITVYGFGQKYLEWPVFSTMNREFSKGTALTLSEAARVHSTFGGHYDLAAYLVLTLPILFSIILFAPNKKIKGICSVIAVGGVWLLVASAAKTALIGFVASVALLWFRFLTPKLGWLKTIGLSFAIGLSALLLLVVFLTTVGSRYQPKILSMLDGKPSDLPSDVMGQTGETWSENARKYGLSMGIRFDTLWPQALQGFSLNPWTGKGYATLNKLGTNEFTEADSTDNNYLRALGETGLLGFVVLFSGIALIYKQIYRITPTTLSGKIIQFSFAASLLGLLINALIIDVFAASKVAFSFWGLAGLTVKGVELGQDKKVAALNKQQIQSWLDAAKKHWPIMVSLLFFILIIHKRPFSEYSPIQSFAFDQQTAVNVDAALCLVRVHEGCSAITASVTTFNWPYVWYLAPWYAVLANPSTYYFANLLLVLIGLIGVYSLLKKLKLPQAFQLLLLAGIGFGLNWMQLPTTASASNFWLMIIGIIVGLVASRIKTSKNLLGTFSKHTKLNSKTEVIFSSTAVLVLLAVAVTQTNTIITNFRDQYDAHQFRAVRRMNSFAQGWVEEQTKPLFVTDLNPYFVDLYNKQAYQVEPTPTEATLQKYLNQLAQGQQLYFANASAALTQNPTIQPELNVTKHFGIQLENIDCEHRCNIYQLFAEKQPLPTQPQSANTASFSAQPSYRLAMLPGSISQFFNTKKYPTVITASYENLVNSLNADGYVVMTKSENKTEVDHGLAFKQNFIDESTKPVVYSVSHYMPSIYESFGPGYQRFTLDSTLVIMLDDAMESNIRDQQAFLFDSLLQLYQQPAVKNVMIISNSLDWSADLSAADYDVLSQYAAALPVEWYFISGQNNQETQITKLVEVLNKPATLVELAINQDPINVLWTMIISDQGVTFEPYSFKQQSVVEVGSAAKTISPN